MEPSTTKGPSRPTHQHTRSTTSVLRSIINPRSHKRNASVGTGLPSAASHSSPNSTIDQIYNPSVGLPLLPFDHPDTQSNKCNDNAQTGNEQHPQGKDENDQSGEVKGKCPPKTLHKKTLSSISLSSLAKRSKDKSTKSKSKHNKPKKSKSHTNISGLLSRSGSSKSAKAEKNPQDDGDKENTNPSQPAENHPPIYSQFASQPFESLNGQLGQSVEYVDVHDEISLYTPNEYSANQQRNFHNIQQPTLGKLTGQARPRPQSAFLPSSTALHKQENMAFQSRSGRIPPGSTDLKRESSNQNMIGVHRGTESISTTGPKRTPSKDRRNSKVLAAAADIDERYQTPAKSKKMDVKGIENAFEALLDSRNVPTNMRGRLRSLDTHIKADFIKQDQAESAGSVQSPASLLSPSKENSKNTVAPSHKSAIVAEETIGASIPKKSRPRSRTFTFSKGDRGSVFPSKRQRPDNVADEDVGSAPMSRASSSKSLRSLNSVNGGSTESLHKSASAVPDDFVVYLRTVQAPQDVEVGKLHKLRLVLRNERVSWVDSFIAKGGMAEIVALIQRIMKVEWREEHEDALLHEVLLCFKALCTTSLALQRLVEIESTVFPALLGMLFDEEKKGPSEFTTRGIVISLLFAHLASAPADKRVERARTVLSYVRDPGPPEGAQPLGFIASMHQTRPYRVWSKEVVNVTKEVFWIFLHNLNVIPNTPECISKDEHHYYETHFPRERPPVPAAPYVGGVEWDATNYIANHLDLMNGILASLPTKAERNSLRRDLQSSGFERMMGGSLRLCKEKFYGAVHEGLKTWVAAAAQDGWDIKDVRMGPPADVFKTTKSSPKKKKPDEAPKLDLPKLELGVNKTNDGDWI
ncbi:MAG: hypothetical protein M4579_004953 [Chaenotheca gracillima]|nr:MAG: hypothetical protein M4579_004953 [Chaenotheca gracillima]